MPRYELSKGTSKKFWEITLDGSSFTMRYGRIGTDGRLTTRELASAAEAKLAYKELIGKKVSYGYVLVEGEVDGGGSREARWRHRSRLSAQRFHEHPPDSKQPGARASDIDEEILADPDDDGAFVAYGKWLRSKGDPRGQLIAVQAALLENPNDAALLKQEAKLLEAHRHEWLGELAGEDGFEETWHLGFIRSAMIGGAEFNKVGTDSEHAYEALVFLPSARFLRGLTFAVPSRGGRYFQEYQETVNAIIETPPRWLRALSFNTMDLQLSWTDLGSIAELYPKVKGLRKLSIMAGRMDLGRIDLPELRDFELITGGLTKKNFKSVAEARWPKLERLVLYFGESEYGARCKVEALAPIFDARGIPGVKELGLCNAEFTDEIPQAIATSKVLKQLEVLDLSKGTLSDAGGQAILDNAAAFAHLQMLDLSDSYLSGEMVDALAAVCEYVETDRQQTSPKYGRYVQVGE